jgi:diguanylate cyclase (GGDEF)-like protein/PAS domain S-box-containing protein
MTQRDREDSSIWKRRSVRDAVAVVGICVATYIAAQVFGLFSHFYELTKQYEIYQLHNLIVTAAAFSLLMLIYALRRAKDLQLEIRKRREAEEKYAEQALMLTTAIDHISLGILMFDAAERLVVCNRRFISMYGLSGDIVKPGASLREIVTHRTERGHLKRDVDDYLAELRARLALKRVSNWVLETADGRDIEVTNYPMANGGWVVTHDDRTESRRREASFKLLFDNNPVAMWLFDRETLRFMAVNDAAIEQYGYSREQFLKMKVTALRVEDEERAEAFIRGLPPTQNGEHVGQHRRADGTIIYVAAYSRILKYENREARLAAINDVTARKLAEDELHRVRVFLDAVIENVPLPILVKTAKDSRFTLINRASEALFGFKRAAVIGKTPHDIYAKDYADAVEARDRDTLRTGQPAIGLDHVVSSPGQGDRIITSKKIAIRGADGSPEYLLTLLDDVTDRRRAEQRIAHMAHSDALTDLPNRAAFNERLGTTLASAEAKDENFELLFMDLDGFKEVNDIYGHAVGDLLLCQVAERLRAAAEGAFIARLGGDEFTIIFDGDGRSGTGRLVERLLGAFTDDFRVDGHQLRQSLCIGIATYPAHGKDAKTLMTNADAALYRAKAEGPGSVYCFQAEMAVRLRERTALEVELRSAIHHKEFRLHYQPQLKMTGEIIAFEALARWYSPARGSVPPATFIPLAEESSLILSIGEWVLREACREAASWDRPLRIAVNVSPVQFRYGDLPGLVHSVLLESGLAPSRLELELTENVLIDDFSRASSILRRLKSLGVQVVLDDFGSKYSSLSYLRAFPFDKIKIDSSFILNLETDQQSIAIVRAVIGLGHGLNIPVLAEGVETEVQHAFLAHEGCDEVQGYLTGRPLAIAEYADVVGHRMIAAPPARLGR